MKAHTSTHEELSSKRIDHGLKMLLFDGVCSQIMGVLTGGAILVAFALKLGASNAAIGFISAIGPLTQLLQIPAIYLVQKIKRRRRIVVISSLISRLFWIIIPLLPWIAPKAMQVPLLLMFLAAYFGLGTISGGAFNSWMRDFIPESIMGRYFGKRMAISTATGAVFTLLAGVVLDAAEHMGQYSDFIYPFMFGIGAVAGLLGVSFLSGIPEPVMKEDTSDGVWSALAKPFKDTNFRMLLIFLGSWNFAINLAAPFFVVYLLTRLHFSMVWVLSLSVLSQIFNVLFFKIWGALADRLSNKSVLGVTGGLFIFSIAMWPFTTMPERYFLTIPLVVAIHVLVGISTAGVNLCAGNIALKLAPRGTATAYLAVNALVNGIAATAAPILAGVAADVIVHEKMTVQIAWLTGDATRFNFPAIVLSGFDFIFIAAVIFGLYSLHRLLAIREEGEVEEAEVLEEISAGVRKAVKHVSNVAGLRHLTYFPYQLLKTIGKK